ncbi:MAG: hypothetical protein KME20_26765 [Kaiparowitsia implicata GSE-PSE-MK54-09C]|nr:hypothetical protein [Kaiparowitsia implicata GSE-PSE-MK54-09C]
MISLEGERLRQRRVEGYEASEDAADARRPIAAQIGHGSHRGRLSGHPDGRGDLRRAEPSTCEDPAREQAGQVDPAHAPKTEKDLGSSPVPRR